MNHYALINIAKRDLAMDEDTYRAVLLRAGGTPSLRAMSERQKIAVFDEMKRLGFKPGSKGIQKPLEGKYAKKLQALWIAGWNLGIVRHKSDTALSEFVHGQTYVDAVRFVHYADDATKTIEGIKGWIERKVGPVWREPINSDTWRKTDGGKIAAMQWSILSQHDRLPEPGGFDVYVRKLLGKDAAFVLTDVSTRQWHTVMNRLGHLVRQGERS